MAAETQEFIINMLFVEQGVERQRHVYARGKGETVRDRANSAMDRVSQLFKDWVTMVPTLTWAEYGNTERVRLDEQEEYTHWKERSDSDDD